MLRTPTKYCCAQRVTIGIGLLEATDLIVTYDEDQPRTYRHREILIDRSSNLFHLVQLFPVQLNSSVPCTAEVYEPANSNRNAAYSQQI